MHNYEKQKCIKTKKKDTVCSIWKSKFVKDRSRFAGIFLTLLLLLLSVRSTVM